MTFFPLKNISEQAWIAMRLPVRFFTFIQEHLIEEQRKEMNIPKAFPLEDIGLLMPNLPKEKEGLMTHKKEDEMQHLIEEPKSKDWKISSKLKI